MILTIASQGPDITAQVAFDPAEIQCWIKYDTRDHNFDVLNQDLGKDQFLFDDLDKHTLTEMTVDEVINWIISEKKNGI